MSMFTDQFPTKIFSVAPMMDCTDRHDRYFLRLIAPHVRLYSEMITSQAIMHGNKQKLLAFHPDEKYVALQLGGSDPKQLTECAKIGADFGYDEINLNVGCPSERVSSGRFGACLMLEPDVVASAVAEMQQAVSIPVTVKCRIGVDEQDSYEQLCHFIRLVTDAGCSHFIIHARKAWLSGLSPKENREIPPLNYEVVAAIKKDFPHLTIVLNGGIKKLEDIQAQVEKVDGVMIGRAAYATPYLLADIEANYFPDTKILSRYEVMEAYLPYIQSQLENGIKLSSITRHLFGLFHGLPGAARWRRYLSENAHYLNASTQVVKDALSLITLMEQSDIKV